MINLLIRHEVADDTVWKAAFDSAFGTGGAKAASAVAMSFAALEVSTTSPFSSNGRVWKRPAHS